MTIDLNQEAQPDSVPAHGLGVPPVVAKPPLLIADEPTGNLDPDLAVEVMRLFRAFNEVGVTVVIASHDLHLIEQFGARRIALAGGRLAGEAHG